MRPFDVESAPLTGVNLIEASAGTGKTWSLARLVVRLVIEQRREVSRILVVTFTEAATEELRLKVRGALIEALARATDPAAAAFLREAVVGFDQAAIHTIHGFCWRVLADSAFESGALFDGGLITDQAALVQEAVDDFWRVKAEGFSPLYLGHLRSAGVDPDRLAGLVIRNGSRSNARILPDSASPRLSKAEQVFVRAFEGMQAAWNDEAEEFLLSSPALGRSRYQLRSMPGLVASVRRYLAFDPVPQLPQRFERLAAGEIRPALKRGFERTRLPEAFERAQELVTAADALAEGYRAQTAALRAEALRSAGRRLRQRKAELGVSYFDDMLADVHRALSGRGSRALIESVRSRYDVALVDEFQDTDPVQFEIFRRLFADLFLIGDPKQAIYSFRGADIHAYLRARRGIESSFTLDTNRRSREPIVRAVNALFASRPHPFLVEDIAYAPVRAGRDEEPPRLVGLPAVSVWLIRREEGRRPSKTRSREVVAASLAGEILRLIESGAVGAGEVAVLVRSHRHAAEVQDALRARGIPAVRNVTDNPFASEEAAHLQRILAAVVEPARVPALRAAVATDLLGLSGEEIYGLPDDEWERWAARFAEYGEVWARRGFYPMFRLMMDREKVTIRLLSRIDGELRLSHLAQLAEKLHETALQQRLGPEALLKWLADTRLHPPDDPQESASRMETDADAVQIVTVHLAKGRQWPVVYCPFLWDLPQHQDDDEVVCHEGDDLVLDLGTPQMEQRREAAAAETLAEELRLLYVALTRACDRLVLAWGAASRAEKSALGYLLHPGRDGGAGPLDGVDDGQIRARLEEISRQSGGAISVEELPAAGAGILRAGDRGAGELSARSFEGVVDAEFRITSFTALAQGVPGPQRGSALLVDDAEDRDGDPGLASMAAAAPQPETAAWAFMGFPRGTRAGTLVHAVLEAMDFRKVEDSRPAVRQALEDYGYDESWLDPLLDVGTRAAALPVGRDRLGDCSATLREVPFTFPLRRIRPRDVAAVLGAPEERLSAAAVRGYLRGYMDLVAELDGRFWLVDWKSNYLGPRTADYSPAALARVMAADLYTVQSRLYALALHRHLRLRLQGYDYERHFGGVIYAFLRGLDGAGGGVHTERPDPALMARLQEELVDA